MWFWGKKTIVVKPEIDYDELAICIAKAVSINEENRLNDGRDPVIVKSVEKAIENIKEKEHDNENIVTFTFWGLISFSFFCILAFLSYVFLLAFLVTTVSNFNGFNVEFGISSMFSLIFVMLTFLLGGVAYEIDRSKDINFVFNISTSVISIITLIVAVATLIVTINGGH